MTDGDRTERLRGAVKDQLAAFIATFFIGLAIGGGAATIAANINMAAVAQAQAAHERQPGHREMIVSQASQDVQFRAILLALEKLDVKVDELVAEVNGGNRE